MSNEHGVMLLWTEIRNQNLYQNETSISCSTKLQVLFTENFDTEIEGTLFFEIQIIQLQRMFQDEQAFIRIILCSNNKLVYRTYWEDYPQEQQRHAQERQGVYGMLRQKTKRIRTILSVIVVRTSNI